MDLAVCRGHKRPVVYVSSDVFTRGRHLPFVAVPVGTVDTLQVVSAENTPAVLKERAAKEATELAVQAGASPATVQVSRRYQYSTKTSSQ